jgi:hypothetical protein
MLNALSDIPSVDGMPTAAMDQGGSGSSSNATSVEGNQTIDQNVLLMKQLKQLLAESHDPALQAWGASLVRRMQWLTASEGYAVGIGDFKNLVKDPTYSQSIAVQDILTYQEEMHQIIQGIAPDEWAPPRPDNIDPAIMQKIEAIVGQVSTNARTLAVQVTPDSGASPTLSAWNAKYNSLVRDDSVIQSTIQTALQDGSLNGNSTVLDTAQKTIQTKELPGVTSP